MIRLDSFFGVLLCYFADQVFQPAPNLMKRFKTMKSVPCHLR